MRAIPLQVNRPELGSSVCCRKNGWSIFLALFAAVGQITDFALVQQMCDTKHVLSDSDKSAITISTFD
ncbi:unnamed protein product [Brassica napus]|uniref:(rape) hypothetical protein n=1 Tax=Brassica napus TaxID=3708 RepID=A0A816T1C7_BRANA|nr:unnamed protein product [Brassica napus]